MALLLPKPSLGQHLQDIKSSSKLHIPAFAGQMSIITMEASEWGMKVSVL
jgi:hypothetical protein